MIVIHPATDRWPHEFQDIQARLTAALGAQARHVAHIGSTAVPGLGAKDVIDIQVSVDQLDPLLVPALCSGGFEFVAKHQADHVPPSADGDPEQWRKLYFRGLPPVRPCHVHVRVLGRANQRFALLFRDFLRQHPRHRMTLDLVKRELARLHADDSGAYYAVKDPVYDLIWQTATDWAQRTGWQASMAAQA